MTLTERVLAFDPAAAIAKGLANGALKPFVRFQAYAAIPDFFEQQPGQCTCGCGQQLSGRRRRWASDECAHFGQVVLCILKCDADIIRFYLAQRHGLACAHCGVVNEPLQVDHIQPVHKGGGGQWLDNYQLLCVDCHKAKTKRDRA